MPLLPPLRWMRSFRGLCGLYQAICPVVVQLRVFTCLLVSCVKRIAMCVCVRMCVRVYLRVCVSVCVLQKSLAGVCGGDYRSTVGGHLDV